jgi:hypothetical protein
MSGDHKHGNGWYYGESEVIRKDKGARAHVQGRDQAGRAAAGPGREDSGG